MFGGLASIPLYLQIVKGASPTKAGLLILPLVLGLMLASLTAGQITSRTGKYKLFPVFGSAAMVVAMLLFHGIGADTPLWQTDLYMLLFGAGLGLNMQTIQLAMQNAVAPKDIGVATSSGTFFRQMGGTLGTAVFLSILFSTAPSHIASATQKAAKTAAYQQAAAAHPDQLATLRTASLNDTSFLSGITKPLVHPFLVGFSGAMDIVFLVGAFVIVIAFALSLLLKQVPLRTTSGLQAKQAETNAASDTGESGASVTDGAAATEVAASPPTFAH
jgi:hypothetical protein